MGTNFPRRPVLVTRREIVVLDESQQSTTDPGKTPAQVFNLHRTRLLAQAVDYLTVGAVTY